MQSFLSFPLLKSYNHLKKNSTDYWPIYFDTEMRIVHSCLTAHLFSRLKAFWHWRCIYVSEPISRIQPMLHLLNWVENNGTRKQNFLTCAHQDHVYVKLVWLNNFFKKIAFTKARHFVVIQIQYYEFIWLPTLEFFIWRGSNQWKNVSGIWSTAPHSTLQMSPCLDCEVPVIREDHVYLCSPCIPCRVHLSTKHLLNNKWPTNVD